MAKVLERQLQCQSFQSVFGTDFLENPMDGGSWWAAVRGVAGSQTELKDFTFTFHFHALEKEMAAYSSVLVRRVPWTEEPGWPWSMGCRELDMTEVIKHACI